MGMKMYCYALQAKQKIAEALKNERGDTNIISIVIVLCIVVALALLFKDQVGALVNKLFKNIDQTASSIMQS